MKRYFGYCFTCDNPATLKRVVLSNDPYWQCSCEHHKDTRTFDTDLWTATDWQSISSENESTEITHINRG